MRTLLLAFVAMLCAWQAGAQAITVNSSGGTPTANYTTLQLATAAINAGTHTGVINVVVNSSTTETTQAIINSSGTGSASYTSILIKPAAGVTASISGAIAVNSILKLNGADNVTVDGSNTVGGTTRDLSFANNITGTNSVIWVGNASAADGASNNVIKNCNIAGLSSTTTLAGIFSGSGTSFGSIAAAANSNNTFQNNYISKAQYAIFVGGYATAPYDANWNITGNTMTEIYYRALVFQYASNFNISNNTIFNVTGAVTTGTPVSGMHLNAAFNTGNVFNNEIYNINNSSSTYGCAGIFLTSSSTAANINIYNNNIRDVYATSGWTGGTSAADNGFGISVEAGGGYNIYHNTVVLTTASAAGAATAALNVTTGVTTVGAINLRNNILINNQAGGATTRVAVYCSAANTRFAAIDYNDYVGSTGLGYVGATLRTDLAGMIAGFGGNANSKNVMPVFLSSSNLRLQPVAANTPLTEGIGVGITTDIDGTTRDAVAPVMGLHELILPIAYTPFANTCLTTDRVLTAKLSDAGTVNNTTNPPLLYYRKNGGAWVTATGVFASGTLTKGNWNFTISSAALGGVASLDKIEYFVVMQNNSGVVKALANAGFAATSTTSISTYPTDLSSYRIGGTFNGTYHVGVGKTFTTITEAIAAYNNSCAITGPTVFLLDDNTYPNETYPITINSNASQSAVNTLTIKPNVGATPTISNNAATAIFKLNGADWIIFDGSNTVGGTSQNLTISNTNTALSTIFWIGSAAVGNGATNNIIKNCNMFGASSTTTAGILAGSGTTLGNAAEAANSNNTVQNNTVSSVQNAIFWSGFGTAPYDAGLSFTGNTFTSLGFRGIFVANASTLTIADNNINNVSMVSTTYTPVGIQFGTNISTGNVYRNRVSAISNGAGGYLAAGIWLGATSTASALNIYNNFIWDVTGGGSATLARNGFGIYASAGGGYNIYYNTISQNVNQPAAGINAAICFNGVTTAGSVNLRNNIFSNTETTGTRYAIYSANANTIFASIDYNDYYAPGANLGFLTSARLDLAAVQTGFGSNLNSKNIQPVFVSATDLHLQQAIGNQGLVAGTPIASPSITTDIDGSTRSGTTPVIGAHEVSIGVIYTPLANTCSTGDQVITATLLDPATVNTGTNPPLIYYRKNGGSWVTGTGVGPVTGTTTNGTWNFTISAAAMGGLVGLETIEYFIIMQNMSGVVKSSPSTGLVATSTTAITTYPPLNSYTIGANLTGTYHVGSGKTFTTITKAIAAYNTACSITGAVTFLLDDPMYSAETLPIQINASPFSSAVNTLTIKPNVGASPTITGNSTAIFRLNGADYITIDGSNTAGGTSKNLTIVNNNAGAAAVVWINSAGAADAATYNTIKNSIVKGAGSVTTLYGIVIGGAPSFLTAAEIGGSNLTIQNNTVSDVQSGIYNFGYATAPYDIGLTISGNTLSALGQRGVLVRNITGFTVSNNTINDVVGASFDNSATDIMSGIRVMANSFNGNIFNNKISNINNTATDWGCNGIFLNSSISANINIYNNFINNVFSTSGYASDVTPFDNGYGISISAGSGYNLYYNTVVLTTPSAKGMSTAAINVTAGVVTVGAVNLVNNILVNNQPSGAAARVAIYSGATAIRYASINYNDYIGNTALGVIGGTARTTLANMITGFGSNANSISVQPVFVSAPTGDLHLTTAAINGSFQIGTPIAVPSITTDIDGNTRAAIPVIGAHEIHIGPAISYTALNAITCGNGDITLSGVTITDALGVPLTGTLVPRVYYKKNGSSWHSAAGTNTGGTATNGTWSFTMSASDMAGLVDGDIVSYYVIAQNTPPGNVSSNPSVGLVATDVNTVTTPPTTPATTVISYPVLSSLVTTKSVCFNASAAQTANYTYSGTVGNPNQYTLTWTPAGTLTDVGSLTSLPASPFAINVPANAASDTYTGILTVRNALTCTNTYTLTLTVNPLPVPTFVAQPGTPICSNTDVTYTTESGMTNYVWTFPGATLTTDYTITSGGTSSSNSVVVKWLTAGSRTVAVNYTNTNGCTALTPTTSDATTVRVPPVAITNNAQMCAGGSTITLSNASAGGTWSSNNVSSADVNSATGEVTPGIQGTAVITYSNGCGTAATITATVNGTPAAITGNAQMCTSGSTITLSNSATNGTWTSANTGVAAVNQTTGVVTPGGTQGTATISYANGCGTAASITATVNATPAAISGNAQMCAGGSNITLANSSTNGTWSSANAAVASVDQATGVVTSGIQGTTAISYSNGCGSAASITATVNATPAAIAGNTQMCDGGSNITLSNSSTNGTWSSSDLAVASVDAMTGVVTSGIQGTATISYANGCGAAAVTTATVNAAPAPIGGSTSMCANSSMTLTNSSTNGTWTGGTPGVATINSTTGVVNSGATQGSATFSYSNGCGSATSFTATVNASPAAITGGNTPVCSNGSSFALSNSSTNGTWSSSDLSIASVNMMTGVVTSGINGGVVTITYANGCTPAATRSFTINATPAVQTFTGGGGYCIGGAGVSIGLTTTQVGVNYQLFTGATPQSSPVPGTGGAITFGTYGVPGYYYAIATNATTLCTSTLPGVTVHIDPLPGLFAVTGGGSYCSSNPTGVAVGLSGSEAGADYQLYESGTPTGVTVAGTGSAISFGLQPAGDYTVVATSAAGCTSTMTGNVIVDFYPAPVTFNVTGGGTYCLGGSGVNVSLDGSETGIDYQIIYGGLIPLGSAVAGTGGPLDMGDHYLPGDYTVVATNTTTGCTATMNGDAQINFSLPPAFYFVGGGGGYCLGEPGVHITLSGSGTSVKYQLYRADTAIGAPVTGTGSALDFGLFTTVGTYTILATDTTTGCTSNMFGSATITVNPVVMPMVTLGTDVGTDNRVCYGTLVTFTAITTNGGTVPVYEWKINNITVTPPGNSYTYVPTDGDIVWVRMTSNDLCAVPAVAMDTMTVDVDTVAAPSVFIDVDPQTSITRGTTVTLTAIVTNGGPAPTFQWYKNGVLIPGATNGVYSNNNFESGDSLSVRVISSGGCGGVVTFNSVVLRVFGVGVPTVQAVISDVRLVPNPNKGMFTVSGTLTTSEDAQAHIEVVNMLGQTIYEGNVTAKKGVINAQIQLPVNVANGMYMLNLQSGTDKKVFHFVLEQ